MRAITPDYYLILNLWSLLLLIFTPRRCCLLFLYRFSACLLACQQPFVLGEVSWYFLHLLWSWQEVRCLCFTSWQSSGPVSLSWESRFPAELLLWLFNCRPCPPESHSCASLSWSLCWGLCFLTAFRRWSVSSEVSLNDRTCPQTQSELQFPDPCSAA